MSAVKPVLLYIDQYGQPVWARTVRELRERAGGGRVSKMYRDKLDGRTVHAGYVVGAGFPPIDRSKSLLRSPKWKAVQNNCRTYIVPRLLERRRCGDAEALRHRHEPSWH
jgi:hypothetical protein